MFWCNRESEVKCKLYNLGVAECRERKCLRSIIQLLSLRFGGVSHRIRNHPKVLQLKGNPASEKTFRDIPRNQVTGASNTVVKAWARASIGLRCSGILTSGRNSLSFICLFNCQEEKLRIFRRTFIYLDSRKCIFWWRLFDVSLLRFANTGATVIGVRLHGEQRKSNGLKEEITEWECLGWSSQWLEMNSATFINPQQNPGQDQKHRKTPISIIICLQSFISEITGKFPEPSPIPLKRKFYKIFIAYFEWLEFYQNNYYICFF